jgi:MFS family permease
VHTSTPIILLFIPLFITGTLGFSYVYAGLAISLYGGSHLLQFLFGHFVDSIGRKRLVTLGCLVYGLALLGLAQAGNTINSILLFVAFAGVGNSLWSVAGMSYLSNVAAEFGDRERMIGAYVSIAKIGEVLSFLLAGLFVLAVSETALFWTIGLLVIAGSLASSFLFIRLSRRERANTSSRTIGRS